MKKFLIIIGILAHLYTYSQNNVIKTAIHKTYSFDNNDSILSNTVYRYYNKQGVELEFKDTTRHFIYELDSDDRRIKTAIIKNNDTVYEYSIYDDRANEIEYKQYVGKHYYVYYYQYDQNNNLIQYSTYSEDGNIEKLCDYCYRNDTLIETILYEGKRLTETKYDYQYKNNQLITTETIYRNKILYEECIEKHSGDFLYRTCKEFDKDSNVIGLSFEIYRNEDLIEYSVYYNDGIKDLYSERILFVYEGNTVQELYFYNSILNYRTRYYENDLITMGVNYDENDNVTEKTYYYYEYWDESPNKKKKFNFLKRKRIN